VTLKYYPHLDLAYTRGLVVQLLKSVQNERRNLMTDEVKIVAEEISSWAQILMTKLHSIKSHTEENMQNMKACTDLLYTFVVNWDNFMSATSVDTAISTSAVATSPSPQESVNCTNGLTKAAHCSNECESALKMMSFWFTQIWRESGIQTLTTTNCC
jgi:hypothetical protein